MHRPCTIFFSRLIGRVMQALDERTRIRLVNAMSTWSFRPFNLSEDELFHCSCLIFEAVLSIEGLHELSIDQSASNHLVTRITMSCDQIVLTIAIITLFL